MACLYSSDCVSHRISKCLRNSYLSPRDHFVFFWKSSLTLMFKNQENRDKTLCNKYIYLKTPSIHLPVVHFNSWNMRNFFTHQVIFLGAKNLLFFMYFFFFFLHHTTSGILAPQPGIEPPSPVLEGKVLITGLLGKSLFMNFYRKVWIFSEVKSNPFSRGNVPFIGQSMQPNRQRQRQGVKMNRFLAYCQSCPTLSNPMDCIVQNTGAGCHFLLQAIFPTQGSNPGLPYCRRILYQLSHHGSPAYCSIFILLKLGNWFF